MQAPSYKRLGNLAVAEISCCLWVYLFMRDGSKYNVELMGWFLKATSDMKIHVSHRRGSRRGRTRRTPPLFSMTNDFLTNDFFCLISESSDEPPERGLNIFLLRTLEKCRFRPSEGFVKPKIFWYAPRQLMVALRLEIYIKIFYRLYNFLLH